MNSQSAKVCRVLCLCICSNIRSAFYPLLFQILRAVAEASSSKGHSEFSEMLLIQLLHRAHAIPMLFSAQATASCSQATAVFHCCVPQARIHEGFHSRTAGSFCRHLPFLHALSRCMCSKHLNLVRVQRPEFSRKDIAGNVTPKVHAFAVFRARQQLSELPIPKRK